MKVKFIKMGLVLFVIIGIMALCYLNRFSEAVKKESEQRNLTGNLYFSKAKIKGEIERINFVKNREVYEYDVKIIGGVDNRLKLNPSNLFIYNETSDGIEVLTIYQSFNSNFKIGQVICKGENSLYFYPC